MSQGSVQPCVCMFSVSFNVNALQCIFIFAASWTIIVHETDEAGGGCRGAADTVCSMWRLLSLMHFIKKKGIIQRAFFIYIVTNSCGVDNKIIMNLILFLVSFISCIEAFYNRRENLRTSVRWPRLKTETSLLLWRGMTHNGGAELWMSSNRNEGMTVQQLLMSSNLVQSLTPQNQFDQKKQAEVFFFFFFL